MRGKEGGREGRGLRDIERFIKDEQLEEVMRDSRRERETTRKVLHKKRS